MAEHSEISWTQSSWNPWIGCEKVSPGCDHCYAETLETRYGRDFSKVRRSTTFTDPLKWKEPRMIFTCSMSDFFHNDADQWRKEAWDIIKATPHTYQILTKRIPRMVRWAQEYGWPDNAWAGVSVESSTYLYRLDELAKVPAKVRFVSAEPLLSPLDLTHYLSKDVYVTNPADQVLDWVIVGGESGPDRRPFNPDWARSLRDQCQQAGVAFFYKQGSAFKSGQDRMLDGRTWDEMPSQQHATSGTGGAR